LEEPVETLVGSLQVSVQLGADVEYLTLFFTQRRLILAHIGKRTVGRLSSMSLLGRWGEGLEGLFKGPGESRRKRKMRKGVSDMSPQEILEANKDNFDVSYDNVVRVELDESSNLVGVTLLTKDDKFEFLTNRDYAAVSKLLRDTLGDKVESK